MCDYDIIVRVKGNFILFAQEILKCYYGLYKQLLGNIYPNISSKHNLLGIVESKQRLHSTDSIFMNKYSMLLLLHSILL